MSYLYGLETLIHKHQLRAQEGRINMNPNAENLFEVIHKKELLNQEKELFLREHLFTNRGGFEFDKNRGLPDIRSFNKHLPNVLKEGDETANEISNEEDITEVVSDITNIGSVVFEGSKEKEFDEQRGHIEKELKKGLKGKSVSEKESIIQKIGSGLGVPIFSFNKKDNLKDIVDDAPLKISDEKEEKTGRSPSEEDSVNPFLTETSEEKKEKQKISLTESQKNKIKEIVGTEEYKEDIKQKKSISLLVLDKDGNVIASAPSKREIKQLKDNNIIKKINKAKITSYGLFLELDDKSVVISIPKSYYNKLYPKRSTSIESDVSADKTSFKKEKVVSPSSTPELKKTTLKRRVSTTKVE